MHRNDLITIDVRDAIAGTSYDTDRLFIDSSWSRRLAGKFSSLYCQSLSTEDRPSEGGLKHDRERVW